ncbi:MAG: hypothetical protein FWG25_00405 [Promicromonosporaceae bacterium]|nr:hypothetical protein [Promicromonosporaceae bacterium]
MEIKASARKHGYSDTDILHAWENATFYREYEYDFESRHLVIGPALNGELLELVAVPREMPNRIIHAQALRPKFYEYLPG